jgi:hypothetical protein
LWASGSRNCNDHTSYSGGEDEDGEKSVHWWESWKVGMGMGIVIGFGSVIGVLALSRRLRTKYYKFVDYDGVPLRIGLQVLNECKCISISFEHYTYLKV